MEQPTGSGGEALKERSTPGSDVLAAAANFSSDVGDSESDGVGSTAPSSSPTVSSLDKPPELRIDPSSPNPGDAEEKQRQKETTPSGSSDAPGPTGPGPPGSDVPAAAASFSSDVGNPESNGVSSAAQSSSSTVNSVDKPPPSPGPGPYKPEEGEKSGKRTRAKRRGRLTTSDQEPAYFKVVLDRLYKRPFDTCDKIKGYLRVLRLFFSGLWLKDQVLGLVVALDRLAVRAQNDTCEALAMNSIPEDEPTAPDRSGDPVEDCSQFQWPSMPTPAWAKETAATSAPAKEEDCPELTQAIAEFDLKVQWFVNTLHIVLKKRKPPSDFPSELEVLKLDKLLDGYLASWDRRCYDLSHKWKDVAEVLAEEPYLHKVAKSRDHERIERVYQAGVGVAARRFKDEYGRTALHIACEAGHTDVVGCLSSKVEFKLTDMDNTGKTPLLTAAWAGHVKVFDQLVSQGKVDRELLNNGALHLASEQNRVDMVKHLVSGYANIDVPNKCGRTALHLAATQGASAVVQLLLEASASVNVTDSKGKTPRDLALECNHPDIASCLKPQAADAPPSPEAPPSAPLPTISDTWKESSWQLTENVEILIEDEEEEEEDEDPKQRELFTLRKKVSGRRSNIGVLVPSSAAASRLSERSFRIDAGEVEYASEGTISDMDDSVSASIARCHEVAQAHARKEDIAVWSEKVWREDNRKRLPSVCAVPVIEGQPDFDTVKAIKDEEGRNMLALAIEDSDEDSRSQSSSGGSSSGQGNMSGLKLPFNKFNSLLREGLDMSFYLMFCALFAIFSRCERFETAFPEINLSVLANALSLVKAKVQGCSVNEEDRPVARRCLQLRGQNALEVLATLDTHCRNPELGAGEVKERASSWMSRERFARLVLLAFGPVLLFVFGNWVPPGAFSTKGSQSSAGHGSRTVKLEDCAVLGEVLLGAFFGCTGGGGFGAFASCWLFLRWLEVMATKVVGSRQEVLSTELPSLGARLISEALHPCLGALLSRPTNLLRVRSAGYDLLQEIQVSVFESGPELALRVRFFTTGGACFFLFLRPSSSRRFPMEAYDRRDPKDLDFQYVKWDAESGTYESQIVESAQFGKSQLPRKVMAWLEGRPMADLATIRHFNHDLANQKDRRQGDERFLNPDDDTTIQEKRNGDIVVGYPMKPQPERPPPPPKYLTYRRASDGNLGTERKEGDPPEVGRPLIWSFRHKALFSPSMQKPVPNKLMEALFHHKSLPEVATPKKKLKGPGAEYTLRCGHLLNVDELGDLPREGAQGPIVWVRWDANGSIPARTAQYYVHQQMKEVPPRVSWIFVEVVDGDEDELIYSDKQKHFLSPYMTKQIRASSETAGSEAALAGIPIPPDAMDQLMEFMFKSVGDYTAMCEVFRKSSLRQPWLLLPHYVKAKLGDMASNAEINTTSDIYSLQKPTCIGYSFSNQLLLFQALTPSSCPTGFDMIPDNSLLVLIGSIIFRTIIVTHITKQEWATLNLACLVTSPEPFTRFAARLLAEAFEENDVAKRIATMERFIELCTNPLTCSAVAIEAGLSKALICDQESELWKQITGLVNAWKASSDALKWQEMLKNKIPGELGDAFLAVIGAVFMDSDFATVAAILLPDCYHEVAAKAASGSGASSSAAAATELKVPSARTSISGVIHGLLGGQMHRSALQFKQPGARDEPTHVKKRGAAVGVRIEVRDAPDVDVEEESEAEALPWVAPDVASSFEEETSSNGQKNLATLFIGDMSRPDEAALSMKPPIPGSTPYVARQRAAVLGREFLDRFLKNWKDKGSQESVREVLLKSLPSQEAAGAPNPDEKEFYCDVCQVLLNGETQRKSHELGRKHIRNMKQQEEEARRREEEQSGPAASSGAAPSSLPLHGPPALLQETDQVVPHPDAAAQPVSAAAASPKPEADQ